MDAPKTKKIIEIKNNLKIGDKKSLLVLANQNKNIYLSSRNLEKSKITIASQLTTYDVLNAQSLVITEGAIEVLNKLFEKK